MTTPLYTQEISPIRVFFDGLSYYTYSIGLLVIFSYIFTIMPIDYGVDFYVSLTEFFQSNDNVSPNKVFYVFFGYLSFVSSIIFLVMSLSFNIIEKYKLGGLDSDYVKLIDKNGNVVKRNVNVFRMLSGFIISIVFVILTFLFI